MRETIIHLHREAPAKPAVGAACNGCGVCCAQETCPAARLRFLQSAGPCPALRWHDDEKHYRCGLLEAPADYLGWLPAIAEKTARRLFARWIAAGEGCDCATEISA